MLKESLRKGHDLVKQEGPASAIRRALLHLCRALYQRQEWYIWRNEVRDSRISCPAGAADCDLIVVSTREELDDLLRRGFSIDSPFSTKNACIMLSEQKVGLLTFKQRDLVSWIWVSMGVSGRIHPSIKRIDYTKEAYVGYALTAPEHRGLGFITYENARHAEYLRQKGKSATISATLKNNDPAKRVQEKLKSSTCGEVKVVRLLLWEFWAEKWYDRS